MEYIQMMPTGDEAAQVRQITAKSPDHVFFPAMADSSWEGAYGAVKGLLASPGKNRLAGGDWHQVWANGRAELWGHADGEGVPALPWPDAVLLTLPEIIHHTRPDSRLHY